MANQAPTSIQLSNTVVEADEDRFLVGNITVTDPDLETKFNFTLSDSRFEIKGAPGFYQLWVKDDAEVSLAEANVPLTITARDAGGLTFSQTFSLSVSDLEDENEIHHGGSGDDSIHGRRGDDLLTGASGNDDLFGEAGDDRLDGGNGNDQLHGGDGDDSLLGGSGNDLLSGDDGKDVMRGGKGADTIEGGDDSDQLRGDDGNDILIGGAGNDLLLGDKGADLLDGGAGNDQLTGGKDKDVFVFSEGYGVDTITDYREGEDKIDLSARTDVNLYSDIQALMTEQSGDVHILFANNDELIIKSVSIAELNQHAADFLF